MRMTRFTRDDGAAVFIDLDTIMTVEPCQIEKGQCYVRLVGGVANIFLDMPAEDVAKLIYDMQPTPAPVAMDETVPTTRPKIVVSFRGGFNYGPVAIDVLAVRNVTTTPTLSGNVTVVTVEDGAFFTKSHWLAASAGEVLEVVNKARREWNMPPLEDSTFTDRNKEGAGPKENRFYREADLDALSGENATFRARLEEMHMLAKWMQAHPGSTAVEVGVYLWDRVLLLIAAQG